MPASARRALDPVLPSALTAAAPLLGQAATAIGWLDGDGRLRWANAALLALLERPGLPTDGLAAERLVDDPARLQAARRRALDGGAIVRLPGLRLGPGESAASVQLGVLGDGLLLEAQPSQLPAAVSVAASLRSLAHELKNPLGGLRGAAQLLSRRVLDPDLRAYAEIIVAEVDRLGALTDRLLAPAARAPAAAVNLHAVLERVRLLLAADGAAVERDYDPSLPECLGDRDRLVQVVLNLARNAVEADASRIVLRSRFERAALLADGRGPGLRIDVVDDGAGVPEALRGTLFLPLVSGRDGGTGLGLATAHEIVLEHGGRIGFDSRPGQTVFSIWLPVPA
jgi:two-component system nitrogen regulation sensor histidine kinase GlnL